MFELRKLETKSDAIMFLSSRRVGNMHVDLKKLMPNLTSSQGHVRSRGDPYRSCCMSLNASRQEKLIGTNPTARSPFYKKL